jgi:hypothetical protein
MASAALKLDTLKRRHVPMGSKPKEDNPLPRTSSGERCKRCAGTGLVCGHIPVIGPGNCCVDYANALCPECKGRGVKSGISEKPDA